ncbi:hypothetical protein MMC07_003241 [Pseudocyphellaria aurata]|nr:hypothetical protein [Pseudocyphellaria aurata]
MKLEHNSRWFRKAVTPLSVTEPTIDSREPTPAASAADTESRYNDTENETASSSAVDSLVVTFDQLLLSDSLVQGIQFGTNPNSAQILLGHRGTSRVSARHCNINVDDNLWIWLHDYSSTYGTAVGYDTQNQKEVRRRETWILAYNPGVQLPFQVISIHAGKVALRIQFPNHAAANPQYVENLRLFADRCKEAAAVVKSKDGLSSAVDEDSAPATQAASEARTPGERLIYCRAESIGSGQFGKVHRVIRTRDGKIFAMKTFETQSNKRSWDEIVPAWLQRIRREFTLMRDNPHPNVAQVFELRETPEHAIIMSYYPDRNIVDAGIIEESSRISGFGQVLDALSHLHKNGVVHRDLKPENFLVEMKPYFKLVITDFGLAKVVINNAWLKTFCGTVKYIAPEVFPGISNGHGPMVDIWSMGVVCMEWIYDIPEVPNLPQSMELNEIPPETWREWLKAWTKKLSRKLNDVDDEDQLIRILSHMIEPRASKRWEAKKCLTQGLEIGLFKRRKADCLVVSEYDEDDLALAADNEDDGTKMPAAAPRLVGASPQQDTKDTTIRSKMVNPVESASSQ